MYFISYVESLVSEAPMYTSTTGILVTSQNAKRNAISHPKTMSDTDSLNSEEANRLLDDLEDIDDLTLRDGHRLLHFDEAKFGNNWSVANSAVSYIGINLFFVSDELKNDERIVRAACKKDALVLEHASTEMRDNKEVALYACRRNGLALQFVSIRLQNDEKVVIVACRQNILALQFVSDEMKEAYRRALNFKHESTETRDNKEVALVACKRNGQSLRWVSDGLQKDNEVVLEACKQNGLALRFATDKWKNCRDVALAACQQNGLALQYVSTELRNNEDVVRAACKQNGNSIRYASDEMKRHVDILSTALNPFGGSRGRRLRSSAPRRAHYCRETLEFFLDGIEEKITSFSAMVNRRGGLLYSLEKHKPNALSSHLKERFGLRHVFLQPLRSGTSILHGGGLHIPSALMQKIADYAGVPKGLELQQLRLALEMLPLVMAFAKTFRTSWAALRLPDEDDYIIGQRKHHHRTGDAEKEAMEQGEWLAWAETEGFLP